MPQNDALKSYREKRSFAETPEPSGEPGARGHPEQPIFVIQKHDASRLHYDLRIEIGGVLKSWAIPKGPSTNPKDKRLAVPTEDHPLDYADFEGIIPPDHYGAGTVIVWDRGTYRNLKQKDGKEVPMGTAMENGHLTIWLEGKKLKGGYAMTRFRKGKDESWLLIKMDDECANAQRDPVESEPESVLSGKTVEEVARDAG